MKKWSFKLAVLYFLFIVTCSYPLVNLFFPQSLPFVETELIIVIIAILIFLGHIALFGMQLDIVNKRPIQQRGIKSSIVICSLLLVLLCFFLFIGFGTMFYGDELLPPAFARIENPQVKRVLLVAFFLFWVFLWLFWALMFRKFYQKRGQESSFNRLMTVLISGSLVELLVAVPAHIISRNRGDCCAPIYNLFGMGMGIAILFLITGPGVLYLYMKKIKEKKGES